MSEKITLFNVDGVLYRVIIISFDSNAHVTDVAANFEHDYGDRGTKRIIVREIAKQIYNAVNNPKYDPVEIHSKSQNGYSFIMNGQKPILKILVNEVVYNTDFNSNFIVYNGMAINICKDMIIITDRDTAEVIRIIPFSGLTYDQEICKALDMIDMIRLVMDTEIDSANFCMTDDRIKDMRDPKYDPWIYDEE